jgi:hypothetical protein
MERNTSVGSMPMRSASQTDFSTFSDPLLESANLRKFRDIQQMTKIAEKIAFSAANHRKPASFIPVPEGADALAGILRGKNVGTPS